MNGLRIAATVLTALVIPAMPACSDELSSTVFRDHLPLAPVPTDPVRTGAFGSSLTITANITSERGQLLEGTGDFTVEAPKPAGNIAPRPETTPNYTIVKVVGRTGKVLVNPFFFAARTQDGSTLIADMGLAKGGLIVRELPKGNTFFGPLFFSVPNNQMITSIFFSQGLIGPTLGVWTLDPTGPSPAQP